MSDQPYLSYKQKYNPDVSDYRTVKSTYGANSYVRREEGLLRRSPTFEVTPSELETSKLPSSTFIPTTPLPPMPSPPTTSHYNTNTETYRSTFRSTTPPQAKNITMSNSSPPLTATINIPTSSTSPAQYTSSNYYTTPIPAYTQTGSLRSAKYNSYDTNLNQLMSNQTFEDYMRGKRLTTGYYSPSKAYTFVPSSSYVPTSTYIPPSSIYDRPMLNQTRPHISANLERSHTLESKGLASLYKSEEKKSDDKKYSACVIF